MNRHTYSYTYMYIFTWSIHNIVPNLLKNNNVYGISVLFYAAAVQRQHKLN